MLNWPSRLKLANLPTPVTRLERYGAGVTGPQLWVKRDELTGTEVSGNKIRKLEFTLAQARQESCDTLITCGGIQSNHCRTTAILGARLGFKVHLLLRGSEPDGADGNLLLDRLAGAEVTYLDLKEYAEHKARARDLQEHYAAQGRKAFFIPTGASDEIGLWGYIAACAELKEDFDRLDFVPDAIVLATGSGGTQGGLILGNRLMELGTEVVAFNVCDDAAWFERKIREDITAWNRRYGYTVDVDRLDITTIEGYVGPGYARADRAVFDTIHALARTEGLFLDPVYTGKAFHGMMEEIAKGRFADARNLLFLHTGGLYGLFPQKQGFNF